LLNRESVWQSSGRHRGEWKLEAWDIDSDLPASKQTQRLIPLFCLQSRYTLSDLKDGSASILVANKYSFEKSAVAKDESTRYPLRSKGKQSKLPDKVDRLLSIELISCPAVGRRIDQSSGGGIRFTS